MKKRLNTFGLLHFVIILVFLVRQLYYFNLISSFVISNAFENGLLLLVLILITLSLAVWLLYYVPSLLVIEIVLKIEVTYITIPKVQWIDNIVKQYRSNQLNRYKRLQVFRC